MKYLAINISKSLLLVVTLVGMCACNEDEDAAIEAASQFYAGIQDENYAHAYEMMALGDNYFIDSPDDLMRYYEVARTFSLIWDLSPGSFALEADRISDDSIWVYGHSSWEGPIYNRILTIRTGGKWRVAPGFVELPDAATLREAADGLTNIRLRGFKDVSCFYRTDYSNDGCRFDLAFTVSAPDIVMVDSVNFDLVSKVRDPYTRETRQCSVSIRSEVPSRGRSTGTTDDNIIVQANDSNGCMAEFSRRASESRQIDYRGNSVFEGSLYPDYRGDESLADEIDTFGRYMDRSEQYYSVNSLSLANVTYAFDESTFGPKFTEAVEKVEFMNFTF